jgi:hypothetical protein
MNDLTLPAFLDRRNPNPETTTMTQPAKPKAKRLSGTARIRREIENEIANIDEKLQTFVDLQAKKAALQKSLSELPE